MREHWQTFHRRCPLIHELRQTGVWRVAPGHARRPEIFVNGYLFHTGDGHGAAGSCRTTVLQSSTNIVPNRPK